MWIYQWTRSLVGLWPSILRHHFFACPGQPHHPCPRSSTLGRIIWTLDSIVKYWDLATKYCRTCPPRARLDSSYRGNLGVFEAHPSSQKWSMRSFIQGLGWERNYKNTNVYGQRLAWKPYGAVASVTSRIRRALMSMTPFRLLKRGRSGCAISVASSRA